MAEKSYVIYRILNTETGQSYVGLTNDFKRRKRKHKHLLSQGRHHNAYLQAAYNKYGRKAFRWEILEDNLSKEEVLNAEIIWIDRFGSYENGYNMTEGGDVVTYNGWHDKPCTWNGVEYPSIAQAAQALGMKRGTLRYFIAKGYTCDDDKKKPTEVNTRPCTWNGVEYPSIAQAARQLGIACSTMRHRIDKGYACDDDIPSNRHRCTWNGVVYPSLHEAARQLGITPSGMLHRIKRGYTCDDDLPS